MLRNSQIASHDLQVVAKKRRTGRALALNLRGLGTKVQILLASLLRPPAIKTGGQERSELLKNTTCVTSVTKKFELFLLLGNRRHFHTRTTENRRSVGLLNPSSFFHT